MHANGASQACLSTEAENIYVRDYLSANMRSTLNWTPFGGKGRSYWGSFGPGLWDGLVLPDEKNVTILERREELSWGVWLGRFEDDAPECEGDGRLNDTCWSRCTSGARPSYTRWRPFMDSPIGGNPFGPGAYSQQPDDFNPPAPASMHGEFDTERVPNTASCIIMSPHMNGTWDDALCDYEWVSQVPFGALWECLCEEGETDAGAQAHFDVLEQRTLDVFHHQRQAVLTALVQVMLVFNLLPILIHIAICRCRRRRTKVDPRKPEKASTDDGVGVAGNSSTPHAEPLDAPNDRSNSPRDDVTMDAELLQRQIARVTESARRQREFVGAIFIHFGWVFWVLIFFSFLCGGISGMAATPIMGHPKVYASFLPFGWSFMILSISPIDRTSINVACGMNLFLTFLLMALMGMLLVFLPSFTVMGSAGPVYTFLGLFSQWCRLWFIVFKSCCFYVPARVRLNTLWSAMRVSMFFGGSMHVTFALFNHLPILAQPDVAILFFMGPSWLFNSLFWTPANRGRAARLINHLGSLGQRTKESEEEKEAATVAALIGGTDAGSAYKMATDNFRAIPLCQITKADLKSNADTGLAKKTEAVAFGDVAAFITHSWQDPGDQKFEALQEWGDEYRSKHGGKEPLVWLDKACVDQNNIDQALTALPVFLAGCDELVVLNGPSYSSRLWCAMEIFTFLKMGGNKGRVNAFKLGKGKTPRRMKSNPLERFDATKATCFKLSDKHKLLGVIETGAGSLHHFNLQVRSLFSDGKRGSILRAPSLTRKSSTKKAGEVTRSLDEEVKV